MTRLYHRNGRRGRSARGLALGLALGVCGTDLAKAQPDVDDTVYGVVVVVPSAGSAAGIARDRASVRIQTLDSADISRSGAPSLLTALSDQLSGVSLDSASGNGFQPTLNYHGFAVSPLQGVSQGLSVYLNGVRFNQAFGDTVNWDLIPSLAIRDVTLKGSDPAFGLNALGGSLNIQLKTGFDEAGGVVEASGGGFGEAQANASSAVRLGAFANYLAAGMIHQGGWRDLQSSDIQSLYDDLGWRAGAADVHMNLRLARSTLNGPGASPVELLAAAPRAQFTGPNAIGNRTAEFALSAREELGATTTILASVHYGRFRQQVENGNATNDAPCADNPGLLCVNGALSTTYGGADIPAFLGQSPFAYAELSRQTTDTTSYGGGFQFIDKRPIGGFANHLAAGASFDGAGTSFSATTLVGGMTQDTRLFVGPGVTIDEPGTNTPVNIRVLDAAYGLYASDTLSVGERLSITASGRYNVAHIDLRDQLGGDLTGAHAYSRFNPAIGAAYRVLPWLSVYANYAEANRAPTPAELSCAGPRDSCSLANFFVGDPDLKQVTARTVEAGVRGRASPAPGVALSYGLGAYRTDLANDILFINSVTQGRAYFANVGGTRRQGLDADLRLTTARWDVSISASHTEATYRTRFVEGGGDNPAADAQGDLTVLPGDHIPGAPSDQAKVDIRFKATATLTFGLATQAQTGSYLVGDETNLTPKLPGFALVNADIGYDVTPRLHLFARVENLTNVRFETFGAFSPTASVFLKEAPGAANPRAYSLGAPIRGLGGVKISF